MAKTLISDEAFALALGLELDCREGGATLKNAEVDVRAIARGALFIQAPCCFVFHFLLLSLSQKGLQ